MTLMRSLSALCALAGPFLLASCASQVTLPALPDCHPANPDAPTTPLATTSGVRDRPAPVPAADPMSPPNHGEHDAAAGTGRETPGTPHDHGAAEAVPYTAHEGHGQESATVYACPMHPEERSESPGTCPQCGMALEPVPPEEGTEEAAEEAHDHDHGGYR
jgi:hypothetical protein